MRPPNTCQAGHAEHDTKVIDTVQGPFRIYDWRRYMDYPGYCSGQDDVSMTLNLYGVWEGADWDRARKLLTCAPGMVYDFGAHIGWYTIMAAELGHTVVAVEPDPENARLLRRNLKDRRCADNVWVIDAWADELVLVEGTALFVKADTEGAEDDCLRVVHNLLPGPTLLLECSPEFKGYYPAMIDFLIALGYAADENGKPVTGATLGPVQRNVWFTP